MTESYEKNNRNNREIARKLWINYRCIERKAFKKIGSWPAVKWTINRVSPLVKLANSLPIPVKASMYAVGYLGSGGIGPAGGWKHAGHLFNEVGKYCAGMPANFGIADLEKAIAYSGGYLFFQGMQYISAGALTISFGDYVSKKLRKNKRKKQEKQNQEESMLSRIMTEHKINNYDGNQNL